MDFHFKPIGIIHSCFKEKFGIPRQPGLVKEARATLELFVPYDCPEALSGLQGFSHIWVIFVFHQAMRSKDDRREAVQGTATEWTPSVRPPRLGGNQKVGVFASRSPFRPNPIGLSVVGLEKIQCPGDRCQLELTGVDLLDGTPVLDIKPYLPYTDALPQAKAGFADTAPAPAVEVVFSKLAASQCAEHESRAYPGLHQLIEHLLLLDPRPAYFAGREAGEERSSRIFGMRLYDFDLRWKVSGKQVLVTELAPLAPESPDHETR